MVEPAAPRTPQIHNSWERLANWCDHRSDLLALLLGEGWGAVWVVNGVDLEGDWDKLILGVGTVGLLFDALPVNTGKEQVGEAEDGLWETGCSLV